MFVDGNGNGNGDAGRSAGRGARRGTPAEYSQSGLLRYRILVIWNYQVQFMQKYSGTSTVSGEL